MEGMMKPVEIRFCTQDEANVLLSNNEMWAPHGNPIEMKGTFYITLVKTVPIRFNVKPDASPNILVPNVRLN